MSDKASTRFSATSFCNKILGYLKPNTAALPALCFQVSVATNFDAPIKLLFPRVLDAVGKRPYAMLGLGDIVSSRSLCTVLVF